MPNESRGRVRLFGCRKDVGDKEISAAVKQVQRSGMVVCEK